MCSSTSEQMTRSNVASGNGRCNASPCTVAVKDVSSSSPATIIAANMAETPSTRRARHPGRRPPRRDGPPRRRGDRIRNRGPSILSPSFETQLVVVGGEHYSKVIDSGNGSALQDRVVTGGRAARGHLPGEALHDAHAPRRPGVGATRDRRAVGRWRPRAPRGCWVRPAVRSRR
jgi:hypothetical protein